MTPYYPEQQQEMGLTCSRCSTIARPYQTDCAVCGHTLTPLGPPVDITRYARPLWHIGLFVILSFGLYLFPWSNRCWRFANEAWAANGVNKRRSPLGRSLTFLLPIFNFSVFYRLAADVREAGRMPEDMNATGMGTIFLISLLGGRVLPFPLDLLAPVGAAVSILLLQAQINGYCERQQPGVTATRRLGVGALVGVIIGALLWGGLALLLVWAGRESTGVASMRFGHGFNTSTASIQTPDITFSRQDHIAWMADLNGQLGETSVLRTFDRQTGGALERVDSSIVSVNDASIRIVYEEHDVSELTNLGIGSGTYLVRYWRNGTVIAQGTFTIQ